MKFIQKKIFSRTLKKQAFENEPNKAFVTYDKAKKILILFESDFEEKNEFVKSIIKQLTDDGKKVTAWGFSHKKTITSILTPGFTIFNKKSFNWSGKPKSEVLKQIEAEQFDLLINLSHNHFSYLLYLALFAKAQFKVGAKYHEAQLYDLSIDIESFTNKLTPKTEENVEKSTMDESATQHKLTKQLYEQIIFYLKKIDSND